MADDGVKVLLDTDILSELFRGKNAQVVARANAHKAAGGELSISSMTVIEIARGWVQAGQPHRVAAFRAWLGRCEVLAIDDASSWLAGEIAGALLRAGHVIGLADVCIAATAVHHRRVLVTGNTSHHEAVRSVGFPLELENWRDPP